MPHIRHRVESRREIMSDEARAWCAREESGELEIFYGKKPWWDEECECWHCERGCLADTIYDEIPISEELKNLTAAQGPVEVVLGVRHED